MYTRKSISDYYREIINNVRSEILRENDSILIWTNTDELSEYYFDKFKLSTINIIESEINYELIKYLKTIPSHERERTYQYEWDLKDFECEKVNIEIPVEYNENIHLISELQSSTFSFSFWSKEYNFSKDKIFFSVETKWYRVNYEPNQINEILKSKISNLTQLITRKNNDINSENLKLNESIKNLILNRINTIKQNEEKLLSLSKIIDIPLKKKENLWAVRVNLQEKTIVKKIKPTPNKPEEYSLDQKKVLDIISFLDNQWKQFEKTPKSYKNMWEEDLRNVLLVSLNSIFEWKATGETFSNKWKSDIYLNIDKWNILVFECKIWWWEILYKETINQLRWYLSWRHNFWVMITFSRNKNFTDILNQVENIIKWSESYINGFKKINDTHFISNHKLEDDKKNVEIHHLFYNLS